MGFVQRPSIRPLVEARGSVMDRKRGRIEGYRCAETQPPVLPGVSYRSVRRWQRRGAKPPAGQRNLNPSGWRWEREPKPRLRAATRWGARKEWSGQLKGSAERAVTLDQPRGPSTEGP